MSNSTALQSVVFLIDNSSSSLNGDFYPNRLDAQKMAIERLMSHYSKYSPKTQLGLGTLGGDHAGIVSSLTNDTIRFSRTLSRVTRDGPCNLEKGIRCAFLALHFPTSDIPGRKILVFVSSPTGLTPESVESLAADAHEERVAVHIAAFGEDTDIPILQELAGKCGYGSRCCHFPNGSMILSDAILGSEIGPSSMHDRPMANYEDDPDLLMAIRLSLQDPPEDPELAEAIRISKEESPIDNAELRRALEDSRPSTGDAKAQGKDNKK
jgi:26S proteasome regulatory subunit N10